MSATAPVALPEKVRRILLVKLSSLGDVVHSLPLAEALRSGYGSNVEIWWAVRDKFAPLIEKNPNLTGIEILTGSGLGKMWALGTKLRPHGFDVALDAQGLLKSGIVTRLSGAPIRVGFDSNREGNRHFLNYPVVPARQRAHMVEKLMGFCDVLGLPRVPVRPQTYLADGEAVAAAALLDSAAGKGPLAGCIVGASTQEKTWPRERWVQTVNLLAAAGAQPVLLGGPTEVDNAARIVGDAGGAVALNLAGKTTPTVLASVLARCAVVIGGDSGPTHLAVAVGTPVVGLYGVTDPARTGTQWGSAPTTILDMAEADAPPAARRPRHTTLPDAIARIPADLCARAALELLAAAHVP